ncbi:hypothetical protein FOZ62_008128, partial [Perkinsus olseni]
ALGMHEKFAGVVTLHTGEEQPSATAADSESSSKGEENAPDSKHYYGGSWFGDAIFLTERRCRDLEEGIQPRGCTPTMNDEQFDGHT